jgi:hypothetical protein
LASPSMQHGNRSKTDFSECEVSTISSRPGEKAGKNLSLPA